MELLAQPGPGQIQRAFNTVHNCVLQAAPANDSLLTGKLGLSVYFFSLYQAWGNEENADKALEYLEQVMARNDDDAGALSGSSIATGLAGLGSVLALYAEKGIAEINLDDDFAEADQKLFETAMREIVDESRLDYLHGAMGVLYYFSFRTQNPDIRNYLEQLTGAVCNRAVYTNKGAWFPNHITGEKENQPVNISLSHGSTGFLLILLRVCQQGICTTRLHVLIREGIRFILNLRMKPDMSAGQYTMFPFTVDGTGTASYNNRLAWCYGDINVIFLLYKAAQILNEPSWKHEADMLAAVIIKRGDEASTLVTDSHFCHGSAGLLVMYNELFKITGNRDFADASSFWMQKTISFLEDEVKNNYYKNREGDLLNGLAGVSLALLSVLQDEETDWPRFLLL